MDFLNLIRYKNLLFIVALMCLMRYAVIIPWLSTFGISSEVSTTLFTMLVLGVVLIAAGGYIINEYFDIKIDLLNRPDKVIIDNSISRKMATNLHLIFSATGIALGLVIAFLSNNFTLGLIFMMVSGLLWFYSASYKRQFLIGNLVVAFCATLVPFCVVWLEVTMLTAANHYDFILQTPAIPTLYKWVLGFSLFAFLTTLIREIIKDMQDEYGDRELECRTMPVVWGFNKTKIFLCLLILLTVSLLVFVVTQRIDFPQDNLSMQYLFFGGILPFAVLIYLLLKAKTPSAYGQASTFMKLIIVIGMLYSIVLYMLLSMNYGITMFGLFRLTA